MKIMKITERYLWIAGLILAGFVIQNQSNNNANLQTLLVTYNAESKIQDAQINDFSVQLDAARDASYSQGFEEGRTQAGVALAEGGSLYNYRDGYHAAMAQVTEEAHLDVSESLLTELNNLRKMVPRLLNQVNEITEENAKLKAAPSQEHVLDIILETLDYDDNADETYLEIIEMLTQREEEEVNKDKITDFKID